MKSLRIDTSLIDYPAQRLAELKSSGQDEQVRVLRRTAEEFLARFRQGNGMTVCFAPEALDRLVEMALQRQQPMRELCSELFKDYEFGLRLIQRPAGEEPLVLTRGAVDSPDKFLSDLVVCAYRESSSDEKSTDSAS